MKCPKCNGTGEYDIYNECPCCNGTGEIDITNEEWLHTLNTEQLADILLHIADSCYWAGFFKGKDDDDCYDDDYCLINQNIDEWLKQPHTKE